MSIREKMEELGISKKASKIYLTLLKMGSGTVMEIAYKADINRCTAYDLLETLSKKNAPRSVTSDIYTSLSIFS